MAHKNNTTMLSCQFILEGFFIMLQLHRVQVSFSAVDPNLIHYHNAQFIAFSSLAFVVFQVLYSLI